MRYDLPFLDSIPAKIWLRAGQRGQLEARHPSAPCAAALGIPLYEGELGKGLDQPPPFAAGRRRTVSIGGRTGRRNLHPLSPDGQEASPGGDDPRRSALMCRGAAGKRPRHLHSAHRIGPHREWRRSSDDLGVGRQFSWKSPKTTTDDHSTAPLLAKQRPWNIDGGSAAIGGRRQSGPSFPAVRASTGTTSAAGSHQGSAARRGVTGWTRSAGNRRPGSC